MSACTSPSLHHSQSFGDFLKNIKLLSQSVVHHLKSYNRDKENFSNYRSISHLSFQSKLTERVVKQRLTHHLSSNGLLNSFQSACTKHHSTLFALISVHDHIIKAMSQQIITALCLLDLYATFDTIDHSILVRRLPSWDCSFALHAISFSILMVLHHLPPPFVRCSSRLRSGLLYLC